jgi:Carboxypeptidase regulatory-like domain
MQFLRKLKKSSVVLTFAVVASSGVLQAQVTGAITGRVTDSSGAIVSGAKVTVTNVSTNFAQGAVTDASGEYHLLALTPGTYSLSIAGTGFRTFNTNALDVKVNDQLRIDASLAVGGVDQTVSVEANTVQVDSESTQLGDVIESKQMLAMPLNGRSYLDLMALQPGVTPVTSGTIPADRPVSGQIGNPGNLPGQWRRRKRVQKHGCGPDSKSGLDCRVSSHHQ